MAQIATILPAPPQKLSAAPAAGGGENLFSPHLDHAIAKTPSPEQKPSAKNHHDIDSMTTAMEPSRGIGWHAEGTVPARRNVSGRGSGNNGPAILLSQLQ
ncbi:MAG: hypothetical protein ACWGOX_05295, partial [Desulforhopalus sp.]